jgi:transcriptional regulator with XRE-family HTH domain
MFPFLRAVMQQRRVRVCDLAQMLRMSDASMSLRLSGRIPLAPHERSRIAEYFSLSEDFLFAPLNVPRPARHETTMLTPAVETR